ncbi:MAG: AtpZ/AtpI family protein [Hyphomicrobiaceae bacterium]
MPDREPREGANGGGITPEDRAEIKRRSEELGARLDSLKQSKAPKKMSSRDGSALGQALRMAIDPVVGVLVGLGIGLLIDNATGMRPLFLIVFLILGGVAGMWNLIRSADRSRSLRD